MYGIELHEVDKMENELMLEGSCDCVDCRYVIFYTWRTDIKYGKNSIFDFGILYWRCFFFALSLSHWHSITNFSIAPSHPSLPLNQSLYDIFMPENRYAFFSAVPWIACSKSSCAYVMWTSEIWHMLVSYTKFDFGQK